MSTQQSFAWRSLKGLVSSQWLRLILFKLLCLALVVGGAAVAWFSLSGAFARAVEFIPDNTGLRIAIAVIVALAGLVGLLPVPKNTQKGRAITYAGKRGPVTVNLDSVEGALARAATKLPEIKKVLSMRVVPADGQKVTVHAELIPSKEPSVNMRQFGYAISDQLAQMAERILGENEVAKVDLSFPRLGDDLAGSPLAHATPRPTAESVAHAQYEEEQLVDAETDDMPLESQEPASDSGKDDDLLLGAGIPSNENTRADDDWGAAQPASSVDIDEMQESNAQDDTEEPPTDPTLSDENAGGAEEDETLPEAEDESTPSPTEEEPSDEEDDTLR